MIKTASFVLFRKTKPFFLSGLRLLNDEYYQVDVYNCENDGIILRKANMLILDILIDSRFSHKQIKLKSHIEKQTFYTEKTPENPINEKAVTIENRPENDAIIRFHFPARYEIFVSKCPDEEQQSSPLSKKYIRKIIVDAI